MVNILLCWKAHCFVAHCFMKAIRQELYRGVIDSLVAYIPEFRPVASMSEWEQAPINAFKLDRRHNNEN